MNQTGEVVNQGIWDLARMGIRFQEKPTTASLGVTQRNARDRAVAILQNQQNARLHRLFGVAQNPQFNARRWEPRHIRLIDGMQHPVNTEFNLLTQTIGFIESCRQLCVFQV